ncbi:MAG: mitofusin [Chrysothrix sp. TS-e1954]|nr:MAG: mitofusin [Chrysothrix sp. TS-e1954]
MAYDQPEESGPSRSFPTSRDDVEHPYGKPNYMTVGDGSTSKYADDLAAMLDQDSGYGSIADGASSSGWHAGLLTDHPVPALDENNQFKSEHERRSVASHVHQLHYNHNRTALGRAITRTLDQLQKLQEYNQNWPAQYPFVQPSSPRSPIHQRLDPRPGLQHTQSTGPSKQPGSPTPRPRGLRRAGTSLGESISQDAVDSELESSAKSDKPEPEKRLVTPQLAQEFSALKINLKMDNIPQTEIIHSLRKDSKALAQLLDRQINTSKRHLTALRERIEDTSSKVLVTGDLNAGKSTFCNALLRRKILPEDEQPCTSIFCEVLDVRENAGLEEVHAIPIDSKYERNDESTYDVFPLENLEKIVSDNDHYSQCKVYVKDIRSVDESLLNNGVLDIALIDAPGLNNDSLKTTAVFARQEEIDVVVFVVSAANHFTLSAREFIYDAAREKAYMFMVVNGFDNIKNKQRCEEQVLKQIAHLSPATFKESSELVHFVSSNAVPVAPVGGGPGGSGGYSIGAASASSSPDDPKPDPDDDDDDDARSGKHCEPGESADKGKGKEKEKEKEKLDRFDELEASLRRFVLEKRARSKLAPAKTYLLNVLEDLGNLANFNRDVAQTELDRVSKELQEIDPLLDQSKQAKTEASDDLDQSTETAASDVYSHTRDSINSSIANVSQRDLGVEYQGPWDAFQYAEDIITAMLSEIAETVGECENVARRQTGEGVNNIKNLGLLHLGDAFTNLNFEPDRMLRRKKDTLARQVDIDVDIWDFFDVSSLWDRQEKVAGTGMAVAIAGTLGTRMIGGVGWVDGALGAARVVGANNIRRLFIPGLLLSAVLAAAYAIASIPTSLPRRLSSKLSTQLSAIDFTHSNALRISSEVRRALKIPADNLRIGLQRNLESLQTRRAETNKVRIESETARKYFGNLVRASGEVKGSVEGVDLEGPAPGVAGGYDD